jgi:hypothetical protein
MTWKRDADTGLILRKSTGEMMCNTCCISGDLATIDYYSNKCNIYDSDVVLKKSITAYHITTSVINFLFDGRYVYTPYLTSGTLYVYKTDITDESYQSFSVGGSSTSYYDFDISKVNSRLVTTNNSTINLYNLDTGALVATKSVSGCDAVLIIRSQGLDSSYTSYLIYTKKVSNAVEVYKVLLADITAAPTLITSIDLFGMSTTGFSYLKHQGSSALGGAGFYVMGLTSLFTSFLSRISVGDGLSFTTVPEDCISTLHALGKKIQVAASGYPTGYLYQGVYVSDYYLYRGSANEGCLSAYSGAGYAIDSVTVNSDDSKRYGSSYGHKKVYISSSTGIDTVDIDIYAMAITMANAKDMIQS